MSSFASGSTGSSNLPINNNKNFYTRQSQKFTLTDFDEDNDMAFLSDTDSLPTTPIPGPTELDRIVSDAIREEAKKHAHDGSAAAKLLRAAQIYFENTQSDYLTQAQSKFLCFSIRRNFRGRDRVEQDVYPTIGMDQIRDDDAGVMFIQSLSRDRFGWAMWSNLDFVYRVVLYDGVLVLGANQDSEIANVVREKFCIGFLDELPDEQVFKDRRLYSEYMPLIFQHDESENAPKIDLTFEFYVTEILTDSMDGSMNEYAIGVMSDVREHRGDLPVRESRFSTPERNISDAERNYLIEIHPARQQSTSPESAFDDEKTPVNVSSDKVTVVRIDTFMHEGKEGGVVGPDEPPKSDVEENNDQAGGLSPVRETVSEATGSYYQDSEVSFHAQPSASRISAAQQGGKNGKKNKPCIVM